VIPPSLKKEEGRGGEDGLRMVVLVADLIIFFNKFIY